jgi:hypothetical protein
LDNHTHTSTTDGRQSTGCEERHRSSVVAHYHIAETKQFNVVEVLFKSEVIDEDQRQVQDRKSNMQVAYVSTLHGTIKYALSITHHFDQISLISKGQGQW